MNANPNTCPPLFGETQAAEYLSVSVRTLQQWRVSGRGPAFTRLGRAVRYRLIDLAAFAEAGLRRSTSEVK